MKLRAYGFWILAAVLGLAACQKNNETPEARGEAYFNALGCVKCHAMGNLGGEYGPNLGFIGHRKSAVWLDQWLQNPHAWRAQTVMPNFHLKEDIRKDLVAYLAAQKGEAFDATGGRPWNTPELMAGDKIKRGEVLFNKAGCVACHSQNGRDGYPNNNVVGGQIPALTKVSEGYTKAELINKIRNGVPQPASADPSKPAPMVYMPTWGKVLKDDEIEAVASYLISLGGAAGKADDSGF
jgi:mono/diheme cytochrome c family protein